MENRARLTLEVVDAVIGEWDSAHVGIRISPLGIFNGLTTPARKTWPGIWPTSWPSASWPICTCPADWAGAPVLSDAFRPCARYPGKIIAAGGYTTEKAETLLWRLIDAVALAGRLSAPGLSQPPARRLAAGGVQPCHGWRRGRRRLYRLSGVFAGLSALGSISGLPPSGLVARSASAEPETRYGVCLVGGHPCGQ